MIDPAPAALRPSLERLLANPTPDDLWQFQKALLVIGGPEAARARGVARAFQACLRTLESKSASRSASRWGAVLGTAAVASVSLPEMRNRQERGLGELLELRAAGCPGGRRCDCGRRKPGRSKQV